MSGTRSAILLDSSALLAPLLGETGGEVVSAAAASSDAVMMSAVNFAETIEILGRRRGLSAEEAREDLLKLDLTVLPFGQGEAAQTGALLRLHRGPLSLGDCACIATARCHRLPVLTADRAWASLDFGIEVRLIR